MTKSFKVVEATADSLDEYILLGEQTGKWLWGKGVLQWAAGTFSENRSRLTHFVDNGCLVLGYQAEQLAGACVLSTVNPGWPTSSDEAMYLSGLMVARFAAGQGAGSRILDACADATRQRGKNSIRLDCWDGNDFLKSFYQAEGFEMLDALPVEDYFVRLFEKDIGV